MASDMSEAIRQLIQDRGISEELVLRTIENTLLAAYKRRYGNADNAVVRFNDDNTQVAISRKKDCRWGLRSGFRDRPGRGSGVGPGSGDRR